MMKSRGLVAIFGGAALAMAAVPAVVSAQEITPEDAVSPGAEAPEEAELTEENPVDWNFRLTSEFHSSDNIGFRELKIDSTDQERIETDDRHSFSYSSMSLGATYRVDDNVRFHGGASHSGLWGSDQLGGTNEFGGFFFVYDLHIDWDALETDWVAINTKIGRQHFQIGGTHRDYFFRDQIDGVTINVNFGDDLGQLRLLPLDLYASQGRPDSVSFTRWHTGRNLTYNMDGDTNTFRTGGIYENMDLLTEGLDLRAFGFLATLGGAGTGADRSHEGTMGNFSDNDYVYMLGGRMNYEVPVGDSATIGGYGEYAYSGGIDRKEINIGVPDVEIDGQAFGGALLGEYELGDVRLDSIAQYYRADGAEHTSERGLRFNHGFVGMRGSYAGGLNVGRYAGWRPSAYVGREGIHHSEHDIRRNSGTEMLHAGLGVSLPQGLRMDMGAWYYRDTGSTNLSAEDRDMAGDELPSGYSRDELEAQERLGKDLGVELNASLTYQATNELSIYGMGGVFLPGEFYEVEISRNAGRSRGSADNLQNFWAVSAGASLAF